MVEHRIMVPVGLCGTVKTIGDKTATLEDTIAQIETDDGKIVPVTMLQRWPVRRGRPYREKQAPKAPMITGQRIIDTLFPHRFRWYGGRSRPVRLRQDGCAAPAGQMGRCGYHRLRRLRRARQRDDGRAHGVP